MLVVDDSLVLYQLCVHLAVALEEPEFSDSKKYTTSKLLLRYVRVKQ